MLDGRADSLALHGLDVGHGGSRRQEWVLSEILEVSATHRSPINVDARAEHEVHTPRAGILSDNGSDSLRKFRIPGSLQPEAAKNARGAVVPNSYWSIGHPQLGHPGPMI